MCVFAGYSWPLEGSDELQTTQTVVELDVVLFHDMFVLYHQTTKKDIFFFASRIFKLAAAAPRWKVEGLREEQQRELRGCNNRSSNKSSGRLLVVGGSVDVLPLRHTSHAFLWRFTPLFFPNHLV